MLGRAQESQDESGHLDAGIAIARTTRASSAGWSDAHLVLVNTGAALSLWERDGRRWRSRRLARGEVSILPAPRSAVRWQGAQGLVAITATPAALRRLAVDAGRAGGLAPVRRTRDPILLGLARVFLLGEEESGDDGGYGAALGRAMALHLVRRYGAAAATPRADLDPVIRRALDYVEANLSRSLRLADLARVAVLSPYHFARRFKAALGVTPHEWVMQRRVARAAHLLEGTPGPSLAHVAVLVGFADQSHFTRQFRRHVGTTPRRFLAARVARARDAEATA
ncbi:MAG: helix-turn-helix transcriptional regulator [bacterium]|nr:helix-turn-helix transcriptional regulator [bacterium]